MPRIGGLGRRTCPGARGSKASGMLHTSAGKRLIASCAPALPEAVRVARGEGENKKEKR